jgi:hexokinase
MFFVDRSRAELLMKARPGSMADVPSDLLEQIKYLENMFTVDQAKLKEVTKHFVKELEKGKSSVPEHQ